MLKKSNNFKIIFLFFVGLTSVFLFGARHRRLNRRAVKKNTQIKQEPLKQNLFEIDKESVLKSEVVLKTEPEKVILEPAPKQIETKREVSEVPQKNSGGVLGFGAIWGLRTAPKKHKKVTQNKISRARDNENIENKKNLIVKKMPQIEENSENSDGLTGLVSNIKNKFEDLNEVKEKWKQSEQNIKALDVKLSETVDKIKNYLDSKFEKIEEKFNDAQKINKEAELNRRLAKDLMNKSQRIGTIAKRNVDATIKSELDKQLSVLKEDRLEKFEKVLQKRKRKKKIKKLKRVLRNALDDYDN